MVSSSEPSASLRFSAIQCLRAIAALAVLCQHAVYFAGQTEGWEMLPFRHLGIGTGGVFLFFMISGFVMAMQVDESPLRFALHRCFRIYPGYLLALAISALLLALFHRDGMLTLRFDLSLLLLPSGSLSSNFVVPYWTLIYEMVFYLLLFVMIALKFRPTAYASVMLAWTIAILLAPGLGISASWGSPGVDTILFSPFNLFFIGGFLLFGALRGGRPAVFMLWLAIVLFDFFWRRAVMSPYFVEVLGGGLIAMTLAVSWQRLRMPGLLVRLGDWSYGLYLLHLPALLLFYRLFRTQGIGFWPALPILFLAGLVAGSAFGLVEDRLHRGFMPPLADSLAGRRLAEPA